MYRYYKDLMHVFCTRSEKSVVSIIGCQRSGSTMMYEIFAKDPKSKVFGEICRLNSDDKLHRIRLNDTAKVRPIIDRLAFPLVVLKPLVESQHVDKLTSLHYGAKCIWLFRDYRDVASSNIKKWGDHNGINNLRAIIEDADHNWRNERLTKDIIDTVKKFYSTQMDKYDAAALFWWVRNAHYFEQRLSENELVYTCHYADLVRNPAAVMSSVYKFIDVDYPNKAITSHVHSKSMKKGDTVQLTPEVAQLCQGMYERLLRSTNSNHGIQND